MNLRTQLNTQHYQQAVQSVRHFENPIEQKALLAEIADRHAFEQAQREKVNLQYSSSKRPLVTLVLSLLIITLICTGYYWQTGRFPQLKEGQQAFKTFQQQKHAEDSRQRNDHYIVSLQNQLRQNTNNGDLWFELGQAYSLSNDFESALVCFDYAQRLLGKKPAILGAMATADYYQHKQTLTPQAADWIKQALTLDPKESTSLLLLASEAFLQNQFTQAIGYWEQVLESENPAIDRKTIIQSLNMAKQRANLNEISMPLGH